MWKLMLIEKFVCIKGSELKTFVRYIRTGIELKAAVADRRRHIRIVFALKNKKKKQMNSRTNLIQNNDLRPR